MTDLLALSSRLEAVDLDDVRDSPAVLHESPTLDFGRKQGPLLAKIMDVQMVPRDELSEAPHVLDFKLPQLSNVGYLQQRQESNSGPIVGGVGAAAAAAMHKFVAGTRLTLPKPSVSQSDCILLPAS